MSEHLGQPPLRLDTPEQRLAAWQYVIESLVGGMTDEGILKWLDTHGPDLATMVSDAESLRYTEFT